MPSFFSRSKEKNKDREGAAPTKPTQTNAGGTTTNANVPHTVERSQGQPGEPSQGTKRPSGHQELEGPTSRHPQSTGFSSGNRQPLLLIQQKSDISHLSKIPGSALQQPIVTSHQSNPGNVSSSHAGTYTMPRRPVPGSSTSQQTPSQAGNSSKSPAQASIRSASTGQSYYTALELQQRTTSSRNGLSNVLGIISSNLAPDNHGRSGSNDTHLSGKSQTPPFSSDTPSACQNVLHTHR